MKRIAVLCVGLYVLFVGVAPSPFAEVPVDSLAVIADSLAISSDTTLSFSITAGSRLYPDWHEDHVVRLQEEFFLGDTPFRGRVEGFIPDFRMVDGKPRSVSKLLGNPAIRVFVYADTGAVDSSWAFLNFPPHFSAKSFYTFQLKKIQGYQEPTPTGKAVPAGKKDGGSKKEQ